MRPTDPTRTVDSTRAAKILALARHEYRATLRSRVLVVLLVTLVLVTITSILIGTFDYRAQVADYRAYVEAAKANGITKVPALPLAPLSLLRGAMEYLEIVGAVIAIVLGYLSVARERAARTLVLIRTRPVSSGELAAGKLVGALLVIATLVAVTAAVAVLSLGLIAGEWVSGVQIVKLLLAYLASVVYLAVFFCLGAVVTASSRMAANGLMAALLIWLVVVLILPQIGDTMDPDNQIPGGLFAALGVDRPTELKILGHFTGYEHFRNGLEEASFAKHFERFAFAMTDVKDKYRGFSITELLVEKRNDIAWMFVYATALVIGMWRAFRNQPVIVRGDTA
jgi:ABC-2 type transport system permease protein